MAGELRKDALSEICCAGVKPTGTVTVDGVTETRIPESKLTVAVPVLFLLASAWAVKVSVGAGFGKFERGGAVYVNTFEPLVVVMTQVPTDPPFSMEPVVQFPVTAFGFASEAVGSGV